MPYGGGKERARKNSIDYDVEEDEERISMSSITLQHLGP